MPLYVRAGSIVPMGPFLQYASEKPADPIELRVYRGANGSFTLYEDEGDSYRYERGVHATIPITWDEKAQTLTIGRADGFVPGDAAAADVPGRLGEARPGNRAGSHPVAGPRRVL